MSNTTQWIRKIGLIVFSGNKAIDLSEFRIKFNTQAASVETPNSVAIRVYNLADATVQKITEKGEFSDVALNAGYEGGNYGLIFKGTIKQYRIGRESATDNYLDILASDGDLGFNQGYINTTLASGYTLEDVTKACQAGMPSTTLAPTGGIKFSGGGNFLNPQLRGTVLFGLPRIHMRNCAATLNAAWSIQNGALTLIPKTGYLPGEAVKINVGTGLIGIPEQTDEGVNIRCLLNSSIKVGGLIRLNNKELQRLMSSGGNPYNTPYNQRAGIQFNAPLSDDGTYMAFGIEHEGDTRGHDWYTNLICLAVDTTAPASNSVRAP